MCITPSSCSLMFYLGETRAPLALWSIKLDAFWACQIMQLVLS
jgi:hypothetical protein